MPSSFGQSGDEIHGNRLKGECSLFGRYAINRHFLLMHKILVLLACCASLNVVRYPLVHIRPPVAFFGFADGLVPARVARGRVIVHKGHNAPFYFGDGRYVDLAFRGNSGHDKPFGIEQFYSLVVGFALVCSGKSGECVGGNVGLSRDVENFVVVFLQVCMPSCCSPIEVSWGFPILEVCVVRHDCEGVFCPAQVWPPVR